jgi:3-hydroxyisobutyrate dehydrogenase
MEGTLKKIGWIGTGVMGKSMCKHLINGGYDLTVYNRTESKTTELQEMGAKFADPKTIGETCDAVFLMLGFPQDVKEIVETILPTMKAKYLIDHTTSSPDLAEWISAECKKKDIHSWDAPVSGGDIGAREARLIVMCGGEQNEFDKVSEVMKKYSKEIRLMGSAGRGQHTKMTNQVIISGGIIGVCEGLIYAHKAGLDLTSCVELLGGGAASSFSLNVYGPRIIKRDFEPGFFVEHFFKDMGIALEESKRMGVKLRGLELAIELYKYMIDEGLGKKGIQGLYLALEKLNNIEPKF